MPRRDRSRYFSSRTVKVIFDRDNYTCIYCGKPANVVDHILSYKLGGNTTEDNGVACCKSCNKLKENDSQGKFLIKGVEYVTKLKENKISRRR